MPDTNDAPAIRSALAYFSRGGLVEMTERTLAEMAAGRATVECDADGVLALCHLAAEALAARARLAVPGEEAASMATRCTPEYAAGFWAGVEYGRHRPAGQHTDALQSDALSPAPQEPDHG